MIALRTFKLVSRAVLCYFSCFRLQAFGSGAIMRSFSTPSKGLTDEMIEKIVRRDEELRRDYYDMPESFPATSQAPGHNVTMVIFVYLYEIQEEALRKRLLHRSRQRGMLEVDLLLGKWAKENVFIFS